MNILENKNTITACFDAEFTGLHQYTTAISFGIVYSTGHEVYMEFSDYASYQLNDWLRKNVLPKLSLAGKQRENTVRRDGKKITIFGRREFVCDKLIALHEEIGATAENPIVFVSDCLSYDWVLFNQILSYRHKNNATGPQTPENVYYIPFDICTMFFDRGIDPDISREEFADMGHLSDEKHNALHDARVIRKCYDRLMSKGPMFRD